MVRLQGWNKCAVITKSDTVNFAAAAGFKTDFVQAIYVGGTGNIQVVLEDGSTCLFSAIPVGAILPVRCKRVDSTNTTATLMVGMWSQ